MVINWVTATSYANQNVTVDRYSIPTIDVAPLTLVPSSCKQEKEQDFSVSTIMQISQAGSPPESYYDYLPRDQRPQDCTFQKPVIKKVKARSPLSVIAHMNHADSMARAGFLD